MWSKSAIFGTSRVLISSFQFRIRNCYLIRYRTICDVQRDFIIKLLKVFRTGGAVCKGATPLVEQPGARGFKPRLRSLLD
jgi:hypothetical protein